MEFGEKLKKIRIENDITQQELADKIFVSRSAIAKWESGRGMPQDENIEALEKLFNLNHNYFFVDEEEKENNLKAIKFKIIRNRIIITACSIIAFIILLFYVDNILFYPKKGSSVEYKNSTYTLINDVGPFSTGECELKTSELENIILPDTIFVWKSIFPRSYRVTSISGEAVDENKTIEIPKYFKNFNLAYSQVNTQYFPYYSKRFKKISVRDTNELYDSREDCGCLISTNENSLIITSIESFIPTSVKEISETGLCGVYDSKDIENVLQNIEEISRFSFNHMGPESEIGPTIKELDLLSIKVINGSFKDCIALAETKIIIGKGLEKINAVTFACKLKSSDAKIFYEGTKSDWKKVTIVGDKEQNDIKLKLEYNNNSWNFYFYSDCEPTEKGIYWHYDENNNPVIWN